MLSPQAREESDFDILPVDFLVEIEQVQLQQALTARGSDGGPDAEIDDPFEGKVAPLGGHGVHAVWGELLVVGAEICGGKTEGASELIAVGDGAEDGITPAQEAGNAVEVAGLDSGANGGAGDDFAIDTDGGNTHFIEAEEVTHPAEHLQVTLAFASETPLVADADFAQGAAGGVELADEILGRHIGEFDGKGDDERGLDAEGADELELVRGGGEKARGFVRTEDFCGVGIERHDDRRALAGASIRKGSEEDGLMAQVDSVENANGQINGTGKGGELRNGVQEHLNYVMRREGGRLREESGFLSGWIQRCR